MKRPLRVVVGKPGLDGHDREAKIIARAFRDAGMEVIYSDIVQTVFAPGTATSQIVDFVKAKRAPMRDLA